MAKHSRYRCAKVPLKLARSVALGVAVCAAAVRAAQPPERPTDIPRPADPCAASGEAVPGYVPRLLRVIVNGVNTRLEYLFLQRPCGALLARRQDLEDLRIRTEGKPTVAINGDPYLNLNSYPGLTYALDAQAQSVTIEGEPPIFHPTIINLERDRVPDTGPAPWGGFVNYGAFTADRVDGGQRSWTGTATLGLFGEPGVVTSDWLAYRQEDLARTLRLATTFQRDDPARISSLRIGDLYSRGGAFGGTAAIGGVQYATNFATRPYLITSPVEMMAAATRRLSVVNLFGSEFGEPERQSRAAFFSGLATAPHGPVEIVNIPTYQNGEYVLLLRDQLGREFSVRQTFFFNQGLLRQGLSDFSFEAGARRLRFDRDEYAGGFAAGTYRYGLSSTVTVEGHAEAAEQAQAAGGTLAAAIPYVGVATGTIAGSRAEHGGAGVYVAVALENSYRSYGYGVREECRSAEFFLATADPSVPDPLACRTFASVSRAVTPYDTLSLSAGATALRGQADALSYRLGYVTRRWPGFHLSAHAGRVERPHRDYTVGVMATVSLATLREYRGRAPSPPARSSLLDPRRVHGRLSAEGGQNRETTVLARVSSSARFGEQDIGVQASSALHGRDVQTLSGSWGNRYLASAAGVTRLDGAAHYTVGAASGVAWIDGGVFPTRPMTSSFALVRLGPTHGGVRVNGYRADDDGDVMLTPMQPYRENPIAINGADLPMNARFDSLRLQATPRFRSGTVVRPRIEVLRDAIFTVHLRDAAGTEVPLPAGGYAALPGSDELFPVGEDGAIYVIGLQATTPVTIHWNDQQCRVDLVLSDPPPVDAIPELGPYVCEEIRP